MPRSEWATWAQAIFSVVAIIIPVCVVLWQRSQDRKEARLRDFEASRARILETRAGIRDAFAIAQGLMAAAHAAYENFKFGALQVSSYTFPGTAYERVCAQLRDLHPDLPPSVAKQAGMYFHDFKLLCETARQLAEGRGLSADEASSLMADAKQATASMLNYMTSFSVHSNAFIWSHGAKKQELLGPIEDLGAERNQR